MNLQSAKIQTRATCENWLTTGNIEKTGKVSCCNIWEWTDYYFYELEMKTRKHVVNVVISLNIVRKPIH